MNHITIISIGKLKESYWKDAEQEYLKRLSAFAKVEIKELKEESFSEKDKPEIIKQKEANNIKKALPKESFLVVLDKEGKQWSSEQFSHQMNHSSIQLFNHLTFIIGGPLGLHDSILSMANLKFSLSNLTFTHQMARVILEEQIYRAYMITHNRAYHY